MNNQDITDIARVTAVSPDIIELEVNAKEYAISNLDLQIGSYLQISDDYTALIAVIEGFRIKDGVPSESGSMEPDFILRTRPVGRLMDGLFARGGKHITIPPKHVSIASSDILHKIYCSVPEGVRFSFARLSQEDAVPVETDGNLFFGKHIGVVGSTGSGKSSAVAAILQEGIRPSAEQSDKSLLNNSHIIIFDIHGEYSSAFPAARIVDATNILLPYWLMNSEELEEMFIESNEQNSHNQISQFRAAVIANKKRHCAGDSVAISYDSPCYFSLREVTNYLTNLNNEVIGKVGECSGLPRLADGSHVEDRSEKYFDSLLDFASSSQSRADKASNGPFNGEFERFIMRLESRMRDSRLDFLLAPRKDDGSECRTDDLGRIIGGLVGYHPGGRNVVIVDLSGIPFEVLTIVVSLLSRIVFTVGFNRHKVHKPEDARLPYLLVYEEAHVYVPRSGTAKFGSVRRSIERIAKEGRKYGISLMIVSQRPSEISESIFSQCNNFVAMRLTNPADQQYVKRLLPDDLGAVTDSLPTLEQREALLIGDAVKLPSVVRINEISELPNSHDIAFRSEWQKDWLKIDFDAFTRSWN